MYLIGIDIGTGSTKAVAVNTSGDVMLSWQVSYPTFNPQPLYCEQSPETIWEAFITCVNKVVEALHEPPGAICLSSAMHSLIPVNESAEPLMDMIIWADNRSASIAKCIKQSRNGKVIYEKTGTPIHAMTPLCKIIWLKENEPGLFTKTFKFISIKEFIWHKLFNVFEIDHSIASATGMFDIEKLNWNEEALQLCEITTDRLSTPVSTSFKRTGLNSQSKSLLNVPADAAFIIGASDGCLANLGSFAITPGTAALTIGTSGAFRVAGKHPVHNYESMPFSYVLDEDTYIVGGPVNNGGVALKWYAENFLNKKLLTKEHYQELMENIMDLEAGSEGLLFLPYILGERAPIWNSESCGVFFGITSQHSQKHFTRSVVEGITLSLYQISRTLVLGGQSIKEIHASGGFVHSQEWLQILADIFGLKIILMNNEDASAVGATFLGMKALGVIEKYSDLTFRATKTIIPDENNHLIYKEDVYPRYVQLYKTLMLEMAIFHERGQNSKSQVPSPKFKGG